MSKSQEFLTEKLQQLIELFSTIRIRYHYENCNFTKSKFHTIEILPLEMYYNERCSDFCDSISIEFLTKFPYELISFITKTSLVEIENDYVEFIGVNYETE